jgi:hypothetical protein
MSHDYSDMWHLIQSTYRSIFMARRKLHNTPPPIAQILEVFPMQHATPGDIFPLLYMMDNYNREALSTDDYRVRNCYDNPAVIERQLQALAADGFLGANGSGFRVTQKGMELYHFVQKLIRPRWTLPPLQMDAEIRQILGRMKQLVDVTFAVGAPPSNWSMVKRRNYGMSMPDDAHPLEHFEWRVYVEWRVYDLWSYRDDAHLATWQDYGVSPFAWEALSHIWNGQADTLTALLEKLAYREYSAEQWAGFLQELIDRSWITLDGEKYTLTETGQSVRDEAEKQTDAYFYAPWAQVPEEDIADLRTLLTRLQDALQTIANS